MWYECHSLHSLSTYKLKLHGGGGCWSLYSYIQLDTMGKIKNKVLGTGIIDYEKCTAFLSFKLEYNWYQLHLYCYYISGGKSQWIYTTGGNFVHVYVKMFTIFLQMFVTVYQIHYRYWMPARKGILFSSVYSCV